MELGPLLDGEARKSIGGKSVCIRGAPGVDVDARNGFGVVGCAWADHVLEPTLGDDAERQV